MEDKILFCHNCGKQLHTIDEINDGICINCKVTYNKQNSSNSEKFSCWACGDFLNSMDEVAQGVCHNCKISIMKKLKWFLIDQVSITI